ncbi:imidazole glycerol phosphate synthase subunit HisH [Parvibaculum sp.]|uniref:imidazole glycerol phosphate synthase subunit HisH n=1 Tax=Parvibaculum sp. TaxID=2024848 RepID=UPI001B0F52CA|nr:imidazole glycerol phosphate synthase subunit HisH [Parvibaculum sp.]MBO6634073.1 imidazole glycerol phosphate synthase subunit HisH [Parvibaculum sp.]MBO6677490.1 imidazole glycerol phosphate synthase subunit HisH [Parvibaculum sp.]MBO6685249.1 imidazole glycerol phosphate synthase subunit HisH [Parvibaculum sp.]MBO6903452.1 imidazole glycerol phosphate synthase subunit HisH [Parvibaculum sp.]
MKVAIIDYGSGNLRSAAKAFERAARDAGLGADVLVTEDPEAVRDADRIVLPGVGAFGDCAAGLRAIPGMEETLNETVREKARPFLGICVGMQLMAARGLEHGTHQGLGWLEGDVVKIEPADPSLKIPHMGWNELEIVNGHPLLGGISATHAYFVHSYAFAVADPAALVAYVDYAGPVTAMVAKENMAGTQFHPEKSQELGLALIGNFLTWRP